jgi:hypothetical protein
MKNPKKILYFINSPIYGGDVTKAIGKEICVLCERKVSEFEYLGYFDSGICKKCRVILFDNVLSHNKKSLKLKTI